MVFAVAVRAQGVAALALEIQGGGVEENNLQFAEQIATADKQLFFDDILGAAWHELGGPLLLVVGQFFAEPSHGAIELVQFNLVGTVDEVVLFPALGRMIAAAGAQTM